MKLTKEEDRLAEEGVEYAKSLKVIAPEDMTPFQKDLAARWKKDDISLAEGMRRTLRQKK